MSSGYNEFEMMRPSLIYPGRYIFKRADGKFEILGTLPSGRPSVIATYDNTQYAPLARK